MFDIGFLELLLISIIGLMVLGPEKLPGAIRTGSLWIGRLKRSFNNVRAEIEKEVGADEIRRQLHNEAIMDSLKESSSAFEKEVSTAKDKLQELDQQLGNIVSDDATTTPDTLDQQSPSVIENTRASANPDTDTPKPKPEQA